MTSLPLRWRIIIALIALALGTTLALSLVARHYLNLSLGFSVNLEMGQALTDALVLAKENYAWRKAALNRVGRQLIGSAALREAYQTGDPDRLRHVITEGELGDVSLRFAHPSDMPAGSPPIGNPEEPLVFKTPGQDELLQMVVPVHQDGRVISWLVVTEQMGELLNVERAVHTYKHLEMEEEDLHRGFLMAFLVAAAGVVLLASLVGIRIGFEITNPLYALIKGTRELARDNLDYRIPPGRDDEIGLLIDSFNRMAEDLNENRQRRLDAEKIAAWREIARRLAHEIKNPLTPIQLTVQQVRDKYPGDDPAYRKLMEDCTEIVTEEVENLRALVQEFADFARMPTLSLSRQDLNSVVMDSVRLYPEAHIRLELSSDLPELDLDADQMRRVLINLIENGLDAAGKAGKLTIRTQCRDETVELLVIDSGPGVSEDDRERIFQPYVSSKESGMGLGLAVVRNVVDEHDGNVSVRKAPGGGAQFEIALPVPEHAGKQAEGRT